MKDNQGKVAQEVENWIHITGRSNYQYKRSGDDIVNSFIYYRERNVIGWKAIYGVNRYKKHSN